MVDASEHEDARTPDAGGGEPDLDIGTAGPADAADGATDLDVGSTPPPDAVDGRLPPAATDADLPDVADATSVHPCGADGSAGTCACERHQAGAHCEVACPEGEMLLSPDFDVATREGVWLCGRVAASSGEPLTDGEVTLVGEVPVSAFDRSVPLESGCPGPECIRLH